MEDHELESALRAALASEGEVSERTWARVRRAPPAWIPSLSETGLAVIVGVAALVWLARPASGIASIPKPVVRQHSDIERTYAMSTRMSTTIP